MATNETYVATTHNLLTYSGILFDKGNKKTPFLTSIDGKTRNTKSWEFAMSQDYTTGGGSQPAITETASLTAPNPGFVTRTQNKNVCQIYQKAFSISYAKRSASDQLSGLNVAGQVAEPIDEMDFQLGVKLNEMRNDLEYTFLNGAYQLGDYDDVAYKTRGIITAISTNSVSASSAALNYWHVASALQAIATYGDATNCILMCAPVHIMQLNADAINNGLTVIPASRDVNGIKIDTLITPFGSVGVVANARVPAGTALVYNPDVCAPVMLDVPERGNFFVEALGKAGAADKFQLYGQAGLDYGAEYLHAKITGLASTFTAPDYSKKVFVTGGTIETTEPESAADPGAGGDGAGS